jgi:AAA+ superfamily predicted ATPase
MMDIKNLAMDNQASSRAAGQLLSLAPDCAQYEDEIPFANNYDYLAAVEKEALLMLISAAIQSGKIDWPTESSSGTRLYNTLGLSPNDLNRENIEIELARIQKENKARQSASLRSGIKLLFPVFCRENKLDTFDQKIFLLLFVNATSVIFQETFSFCNFEVNKRGIKISILLSILCRDYTAYLEKRKCFSRTAPLVANEIVFFSRDVENRNSHVMDEIATINERHIRYIVGDDYLYNSTYPEISVENSSILLDTVVMPDNVKEQLVLHVDKYLRQREGFDTPKLDEFFGYGTALTIFFQGASGTGKTMLARALAHHFNRQIITVNLGNTHYHWQLEHLMVQAFREASLLNGFVFFDEADDIFKEGSYLARSLLVQIEKARCVIIFATNKAGQIDPAMERRLSLKIHFPLPDAKQRLKIWRALIPDFIALSPDVDLNSLNDRYPFSGGLIKNTIFLAANSAETDGSGNHVITRHLLEQAADLQTKCMNEYNKFCKIYRPVNKIDNLPLTVRQCTELKNIAKAFQFSWKNETGINILISGANIETGISAAEALAAECGMKVKSFKYNEMDTFSKDNEIMDMVSQEKIKLVDYAFCRTTEEAHLLLIIDYNGTIQWTDTGNQNDMGVSLSVRTSVAAFLNNLHGYQGICCLVMHECPQAHIPLEFHAHLKLDHPPEERQMQHWENHLAPGTFHDRDLIALVEQHPMHIAEIDAIIHRASIQSIIEGKTSQLSLEIVKTVIAQYCGKTNIPLLFGKS